MGRAFEYRRAAKEKRWDKMSKIFPKLAKAIQMAAREGGRDPETNSKLRAAIQNAKAENMPKDNIENAINRAVGKDAEALNEVTFEGKVSRFLSSFSDNVTELTWDTAMKDNIPTIKLTSDEGEEDYLEIVEITDQKMIVSSMGEGKVTNLIFEKE